uniref:Rab11 family-interacting protein 3 n=1 Tax=Danio rerio TaxID=7955 RepID=RFIP3_DANRE|nr:RecName: Full=Rab11 family-interacting protein 3; Short=FIP3-Rab11; Short=Rab11-FIP3 [Danio rerio]
MEQVLSSPQGCSEWEVNGKTEWESDQNPLGFLLVDKENSSVADPTNEIFQENAINLDDLFWASQTYSWENGLDCVYPEWKAQPPPSQDLKGDGNSGISQLVEGDLICFNSRSASPSLADRPVQDNNLYDHAEQVEVTATSSTLNVCTGELGINAPTLHTDKTLLQDTHLMLEESHLTNCEFSCNSGVENESQNFLSHGTRNILESEGLFAVSPVEVSCVDTNSNPKPTIVCQTPPLASEHIYLSSSALPCEPVFPMTCTKPHVPPYHAGSATLPMDEVEMMLPKLQGGEGESSKPSANNRTLEPQRLDANTDTTHLSVCPLGESDISPEHCEEMLHELSTKCTVEMVEEEVNKKSVSSNTTNTAFSKPKTELCEELSGCTLGVLLETVSGDVKEEAASDSRTDHVFPETQTDLAPVALIDSQAEDPSTESLPRKNGQEESKSALPVSTPEHNALFELSSGNVVLPEDHSQSTFSAQTQALSEVDHDGDLTPDGMLTDNIVCEAVTSIDSVILSLTDSFELPKLSDCDLSSHDFESHALTLEIQNNVTCVQTGSVDNNPEEMSTPFTCTDNQLTVTGGLAGLDLTETTSQSGEASGEGEAGLPVLPTHQEDFHQLTPSEINLAQEQQVSSVVPSSPPSHRDVFPCGASLDGEAYLTLMENNPDTLKHAEMTLDLCKASDALPTKSLQIAPVDLIHVPIVSATAPRSEEQSALRAVFQALDQDGDGFVHIEEFIEFAKAYGAEQVKDLTRFLDPSGLGVISFEDFHRGISAISNEESAYSECETFTDEDTTALVHPELHEDVETDSGIENTLTDGDDRNSPSSFPASFQNFLQSEALEFFCTHCHKQISRLEDLSTRLQLLEMNRHLQQSNNLDVMGDLTQDILDLADRDITDKVLLLEKRVCELEKDSLESEEQHARLRQENLTLVHRANALEEQLKEQELRTEEDLLAQTRKHRDALNKLQRERDLEIENLQARLHQLDEENSELRSCVPCLRANIERLEEEKRKLQDEADDITQRLNEESESRRKMSDKLSHERHTNQKEKECTQGLIEDLRKQLEHLQLFKLETEARRGRSSSNGLQEYNTHMRENELEQEIRRLKQDNRSLKEQNDELNGQIINLSIQGAKSLFTESLSESLAAEINNVSRAELMEAIHKQEEINFRLQDYIDRIIVAIMESNPSILEVK